MKKHIEKQIVINASADRVWKILSDFQQYAVWSPTIKKFYGKPVVGKRTRVRLEQPGGKGITMNPVFLQIDANQQMRWKGQLFIGGLFDGEHYFLLQKITADQTLFKQGEYFSGILVGLFAAMIDGSTSEGFEQFNQAVKKRAETVY